MKYNSLFNPFSHKNIKSELGDWFWDSENQEFKTVGDMRTYGGSFVQQLAQLYQLADRFNKLKLINTFEYFEEYKKFKK